MPPLPKKCPSCRQLNSGLAARCRCNYDFVKNSPKKAFVKTLTIRTKAATLLCPSCGSKIPRSSKSCTCGHLFSVWGVRPREGKKGTRLNPLSCQTCGLRFRLSNSARTECLKCPRCQSGFAKKEPSLTSQDIFRTQPYEILGISPGTDRTNVRKAYLSKIALYHPDKVARLGHELRDLAEKKTLELNFAYQMILSGMKK